MTSNFMHQKEEFHEDFKPKISTLLIEPLKDSQYWSLHSEGKRLEPLVYSNNKTQEDIVKEVFDLINLGKKVIFIHGVCGTGKSVIALNIARLMGKTAIVVPVKNLQKQYENDYTNKKYILKPNGEKMKISSITGRDNHDSIIFPGSSCADPNLPDTIVIAEKNKHIILDYYAQNPFIQNRSFSDIRKIKRISIAPSNPYWSPIRPADYELSQLTDAKRKKYNGVMGKEFIFYHRKEGCSYYDQFQAYIDSDVIIFNSAKYEIELAIGRKPETAVDIIDEADEFLDNFSKEASLNITHLITSLQNVFLDNEHAQNDLERIKELLSLEMKNKVVLGINENEISSLKDTFVGKVLKIIIKNKHLQTELSLDELHYANKMLELAALFEDVFDDAYVTYNKLDKDIYVNVVTTNVAKKFAELRNKTNVLILMSGTLHSPHILKNVFGIKDFSIVEAETRTPGKIDLIESGREFDCSYKNLKSSDQKRKEYLFALSECLQKAKSPTLVHVNAFEDLPNELEIKNYGIKNLPSRESIKDEQIQDKHGSLISSFKARKVNSLFTTKCSRGVDFPGDMCNSIIFTKYPNPNTQNIFWKILKMTHPQYFWEFYKDKAQREFLQRIYRALRSKNDHVYILSPDTRVFTASSTVKY